MDEFNNIVGNILVNSISDCNNYSNKNYTDCVRCLSCAGLDDLGEMICCKEIELAEE